MPLGTTPLSITEDEGIAWTENWRDSSHQLKANSFVFDADEFKAVLEEPNVKYVRLYVSLKLNSDNTMEEKLILVGADSNYKDILNAPATGGSTGIYDFSHPCPPLCKDDESRLAGGTGD